MLVGAVLGTCIDDPASSRPYALFSCNRTSTKINEADIPTSLQFDKKGTVQPSILTRWDGHGRQADTNRQTGRQADTDRQAGRQADTERQTNKQTNKQTKETNQATQFKTTQENQTGQIKTTRNKQTRKHANTQTRKHANKQTSKLANKQATKTSKLNKQINHRNPGWSIPKLPAGPFFLQLPPQGADLSGGFPLTQKHGHATLHIPSELFCILQTRSSSGATSTEQACMRMARFAR